MRENRTYGSEGGATQLNALFLPLSKNKVSSGAGMIVRDISHPAGAPVMRFAEPPLQRWQTLYSSSFSSVLPLPAGATPFARFQRALLNTKQ
jgi:hypothetical protein